MSYMTSMHTALDRFQRLTSARQCDTIFVLDQGCLVEQGTHEELCERQGRCWRLYSEQQV
jgi:subfamily B ATP-binding cassette protein HlyB/CyaB